MLGIAEELIQEPGKFNQNSFELKQKGHNRGYSTSVLKVGALTIENLQV